MESLDELGGNDFGRTQEELARKEQLWRELKEIFIQKKHRLTANLSIIANKLNFIQLKLPLRNSTEQFQ